MPVHHGTTDFERVDRDEEEHAHADLDAALDDTQQEVEREDGVGDHSKQRKSGIQFDDDGVQEGTEAVTAVEHQREDDLYDPRPRDDHAPHANEKLGPRDDWVATCLLVANLQSLMLYLKFVSKKRLIRTSVIRRQINIATYTMALNLLANSRSLRLLECVAKPACFSLPTCRAAEVFCFNSFFFLANSATSLRRKEGGDKSGRAEEVKRRSMAHPHTNTSRCTQLQSN